MINFEINKFYLIIFYYPCIFEYEHYSNLKCNVSRVISSVHISASIPQDNSSVRVKELSTLDEMLYLNCFANNFIMATYLVIFVINKSICIMF